MKNNSLAIKVKELRRRKGYSQEELSEKTGLSVRTIQRIENGESNPTGESIKRIAIGLEVTPDELIDWKVQEDKSYLVVMSLSALSFLLFPLLGIIIPLIFWVSKKDKLKGVNELGKRILNFQITWILLFSLPYIILFARMFRLIPEFGIRLNPFHFLLIPLVFYTFNVLLIVINSVRAYQDKNVWYRPAIRILR